MSDQWYLWAGETTVDGPHTAERLRELLALGRLKPEQYIRRGDEPWGTIADTLPSAAQTVVAEAAQREADADEDALEMELELSPEQPGVAADDEHAVATNDDFGSVIAVDTASTQTTGVVSSYAAKRTTTNLPRRGKKAWTKNPQVMLAAAIVIGGLAAIVVGKLVLWIVRPAPRPVDPYGARPHNGVIVAAAVETDGARKRYDTVRRCSTSSS